MDILTLLQNYSALLQNNVMVWFLCVPLLLIATDVVTGVLSAMKRGIFNWKLFSTFIGTSVVPYLTIVLTVFLAYLLFGSSVASNVAIAFGMVVHGIALLGSIVENLKELGVSSPIVQEVDTLATSYLQHDPLPPVQAPPQVEQKPFLGPIGIPQVQVEKQPTQAQPALPIDVVRTSTPLTVNPVTFELPVPVQTPPPAPAPAPAPLKTDSIPMPAVLPTGL